MKFTKTQLKGMVLLLTCALFWGSTFIVQDICSGTPFTLTTLRFSFGTIIMLPILLVSNKLRARSKEDAIILKETQRKTVKGGIICGMVLALSATLQQIGFALGTTAGKAGVLSGLYMIFIPFALYFLFKRKLSPNVWVAALLAVVGTFLISFSGASDFCLGDVVMIISAVSYTAHVILVDKFVAKGDGFMLSQLQLLFCSLTSAVPFIIVNITGFEVLTWELFTFLFPYLLSIAFFSCVGAYTLQILGQKYTPPTAASIIMSLESVFALVFGVIILGETFTLSAGIGIAVMLLAIFLSQVNVFEKRKKPCQKLPQQGKNNFSDKE